MDTKTTAATPWPTHDTSTVPPGMRCPASREAQEQPHKTINRAHPIVDPRHPGEHRGEYPKHVPNEGTLPELLAAALHRQASRADGDRAQIRYFCKRDHQ
jgi:hypothetical protein